MIENQEIVKNENPLIETKDQPISNIKEKWIQSQLKRRKSEFTTKKQLS